MIESAWWAAAGEPEPIEDGDLVTTVGIDMPPDRTVVSVGMAVCERDARDRRHVELAHYEATSGGVDWLVDWLAERWDSTVAAVAIDRHSPAATLVEPLREAGVKVTVTSAADLVVACAGFADGVRDGHVSHYNQQPLDVAVANGVRRNIGDGGGWAWNRRFDDVDVSPLVAVTLADWAVRTTKRRPGRKTKVRVG